MSSFIEYKGKTAFHPGYYLKEIIDESGLSQEDYALRLGTTPKNLSILLRGEQSLSIDIAVKLARLLGGSIEYWLNLQRAFDEKKGEIISEKELEKEKEIFSYIDYKYFIKYFSFPEFTHRTEERIKFLREFLNVSSLVLLSNRELTVKFRSYSDNLSVSNVVNANVMVQIAVNEALKRSYCKFNLQKCYEAINYALTLTCEKENFLTKIQKSFEDAGVSLVVLPYLKNSGINGAVKKIGSRLLLMVNDRRGYADTLWFTLFHEIGHVINKDYGISIAGESEEQADLFAKNMLIPKEQYKDFINNNSRITKESIKVFADLIGRDPGIVLGRLLYDKIIPYTEAKTFEELRYKYRITN
ncbi:MAG: HigA family addiction module antitoxin [Succinivibrio dextrinosolvens]|uniref:HigA family addiction module antitoxin n=1 Tax=Succinivibrio sp. TaxID=2053619 RepID=UPI0025DE6E53|nr:HigA family addiction module antitoxin [Succinivibrio sp.]MBQ9220752.1 HigA family addiction module antidote protein [Succinivibrio sp.]MDY6466428.1 HigA family addiction module antitoxin [Succinivibrio dextrinosolvens]